MVAISALSGFAAKTGANLETQVAIVFECFGPYHYARAAAAASVLPVIAIQHTASSKIYEWATAKKPDALCQLTLRPPQEKASLAQLLNEKMPRDLSAVFVNGWGDYGALEVIGWASRKGIPIVVMSESSQFDFARSSLKEALKRKIVRLFSAALVGGRSHAAYLVELGMDPARIFLGYDAIDNNYFAQASSAARKNITETRNKLGLPQHYFLASARFIEKKNLSRLIQAYARYRTLHVAHSSPHSSAAWSLVLLGDGPLRPEVQAEIDKQGLQKSVVLPGFKQYEELPQYYGCADAFIHASTSEQWGLVVNEAMACGLPVLVSNRCGCAHELVEKGRNGFTFDPENIEEIGEKMHSIASLSADALGAMGEASRSVVSQWGPNRFAEGFAGAVNVVLQSPVKRAGLMNHLLLSTLSRFSGRHAG